MIIQISSQKGGSGKSTLATNIAVALAHRGSDVLLVDSDRQITSTTWWSYREKFSPDLPKINCIQKYNDLRSTLLDLDARYQFVIVDTGAHDSEEMRSAMAVSDIVITPFRPSTPDLDTLYHMNKIVTDATFHNASLISYACINSAPTNSKNIDINYAQETIGQYKAYKLLNTILFDRRVYRDAIPEGLGVIEMKGKSASENSARDEIMSLVAEVINA